MVWGKALYSSMKVISNSGWTVPNNLVDASWFFLNLGESITQHRNSAANQQSVSPSQTSAGDGFFSTSANFLKKAAGWTAASAGHISRPGSAKASGIWFIWSSIWTNFRKIPHSRHLRRCCQVSLPLVAKRFWKTGRSVSKTWQQHQRNTASVSSQRCLRITPAVGMLHIVTLWMHPDTWVMLGFKSFFGPKSLQSLRP